MIHIKKLLIKNKTSFKLNNKKKKININIFYFINTNNKLNLSNIYAI